MSQMPKEVFISYARADHEVAGPLVERLGSVTSVWVDIAEILPSDRWDDEIADAIDACTVFLLLVSPDSLRSPVVLNELAYAEQAYKPIIPLHLCPVDRVRAPLCLSRLHYLTLYEGDPETNFGVLLDALRKHGVAVRAEASTPD
ncbi:MAG: toll/interleukin-1 receptor domain-containing protein, partial [Armatimonadota bacterium]